MARTTTLLAAGAGFLGAAAVAAGAATTRRWAAAPDPTGGEPLCLPDGDEHRIGTDDGAKLAVTVAGDGPDTYVLAHGWTQDRRVWGPVARRLVSRGDRVILYDHRGHGDSLPGESEVSLELLASDLATVLRHFDARDAVLAGHSMGGMTAQALALTDPATVAERVTAVVLVSTACDGLTRGQAADRLAARLLGSPVPELAAARPRLGPFMVRGSCGRQPALSHLHSARQTLASSDRVTRVGCLRAMQGMDFTAGLAELDLPVTVVCGTHDRLTPPARSRRLAELIPGARLTMVPDAGHMLPWEAPDLLVDLLVSARGRPDVVDLRDQPAETEPDRSVTGQRS
ncbi:MAG TPA: alpha/beta fold hydrolase [Acidimicrobiales bacterium]|nr:alpha/beta fold hydrolase [Acidimicrobiales bacterium]